MVFTLCCTRLIMSANALPLILRIYVEIILCSHIRRHNCGSYVLLGVTFTDNHLINVPFYLCIDKLSKQDYIKVPICELTLKTI
jgi:hypothetical protein